MEKTFWTWEWIGGGYNSCSIGLNPTLEDAKKRAEEIGKPVASSPRSVTLVADPKSFRKVTTTEMVAIDRSWASAFD